MRPQTSSKSSDIPDHMLLSPLGPMVATSKSSEQQAVVNLVNSILGAAVLSFAFCTKGIGILLLPLVICVAAIMNRVSQRLMLYSGALTNRLSYEGIACAHYISLYTHSCTCVICNPNIPHPVCVIYRPMYRSGPPESCLISFHKRNIFLRLMYLIVFSFELKSVSLPTPHHASSASAVLDGKGRPSYFTTHLDKYVPLL